MTQTLRRELRLRFFEILESAYQDNPISSDATEYNKEQAEALANAALEVAGIAKREIDKDDVIARANRKMDAILDLANAPGIKREARISSIQSYLGETFRRNTETKEWLAFAKYIDSEFQSKGWDVKVFVSWLFGQKDYNPQFWPVKKMMEFYPSAFAPHLSTNPQREEGKSSGFYA